LITYICLQSLDLNQENLHFKDSHVVSKEQFSDNTYMQNKINLLQMTCGYLWVGHSTLMFNTDEKSGQRFILEAPNCNFSFI
jgi:hypothetical protein